MAREERLLDTLSRGVDNTLDTDGDSDTTSGSDNVVPGPAEPVNANIEIDISSMESNSEVIIPYHYPQPLTALFYLQN